MDFSSYLDTAILALIGGVISVAVNYVVSFIKDKKLDSFVAKSVKEAEILYADPTSKTGKEKFAFVAKEIVAFTEEKLHFQLDEKYIEKLIEAAVVDLKAAIGDALKK
jgi:uncharacterized membrane protein YgaE (UPF0421/DUF939 family)